MKPAEARLHRALETADPAIRLYLFHGSDESGARALAAMLGKALGPGAERVDLTGAALKADPARLADEAASISMFGDRRWIRIEPAGDEIAEAVAALLEAPAAGNPVVAIAPSLRKDARTIKLIGSNPAAIVHTCYPPEGESANAVAVALGRALGLKLAPDIARRIATGANNDRAIMARELEKLALYLDADAEAPKVAEHEALDAIGAAAEEGDLSRLAGLAFAGDPAGAEAELARLAGESVTGIPLIRALIRRGLLLAQLRAQMAGGDSVDRVMESAGRQIFWKERDMIARTLARWDPESLALATERLAEAERQVKTPGYAGDAVVDETVLAIARRAARRR